MVREKWQAHLETTQLRPVLVIDEAQETLPVVLRELRLLTSKEFDSQSLLFVVLAGDLRLAPKVAILRAGAFLFDLSALATFTFPTASSKAYLGERTVSFVPEVAASTSLKGIHVAANLAYRVR